jgi:pseudouridine-5'-phosphate glycosidase
MKYLDFFEISEEIKENLNKGIEAKPVVALESNLITHGLPFPENITTALNMEKNIKDEGAIPATIAIMNGKIKVGLTNNEIENLAHSKDVIKASKRDLAAVIAKKHTAGTTVSLTMWIAHHSKIMFFATGGIGGVHQSLNIPTMDISTDLTELARTPVIVICSGAKSILDIPRTLEYLETMGVPVFGFRTNEFPAFYCQSSHLKVDYRLDEASEAAQVIKSHFQLKMDNALLIANPVPTEFAIGKKKMDNWIARAHEIAEKEGIKGKQVTPFLLNKIKELSEGKSLKTNMELLKYNATIAAQIAGAYQELLVSEDKI